MQIFPAIDLRGGQVVRLYQGDYDQETVYGADPCAQARAFLSEQYRIRSGQPDFSEERYHWTKRFSWCGILWRTDGFRSV